MDVVVRAEDTSLVLVGVFMAFNPCTVRGVALVGGLLWSCKECTLPDCILPVATRQPDSWSIETDVNFFVARFVRMDVVVCAEATLRVLAGVVTAFNPFKTPTLVAV